MLRQIAAEVQEPTAIVVRGKWIFQDAKIDIAIRTDGRSCAALVGGGCIEAGSRIDQATALIGSRVLLSKANRYPKPKSKLFTAT